MGDCGRRTIARGLCTRHYQQWKKRGTPAALDNTPTRVTAIERVLRRVDHVPGPLPTPCWVCSLGCNANGYAQVMTDDQGCGLVHRITYEHYVGPIPAGYQIDHLCKVRACCNPEHLEAVTARENTHRSDTPNMIIVRSGICKNGHTMDDAYVKPNGMRTCRTCRARRGREAYDRLKADRLIRALQRPLL